MVVDDLRKLFIGSVSHVEENKKDIVKCVHRYLCLGVYLMNFNSGDVIVQNGSYLSFVINVK